MIVLSGVLREFIYYGISYPLNYVLKYLYDYSFLLLLSCFVSFPKKLSATLKVFIASGMGLEFFIMVRGVFTQSHPIYENFNEVVFQIGRFSQILSFTMPVAILLSLKKKEEKKYPHDVILRLIALFLIYAILSDLIGLSGREIFHWFNIQVIEVYYLRFYPYFFSVLIGYLISIDVMKQQLEVEVKSQIGDLAIQVAHDIRSPVAALEVISKNVPTLPYEAQELLGESIKNIRRIADDLLSKAKRKSKILSNHPGSDTDRLFLDAKFIQQIIAEKCLEYQARPNIEIKLINFNQCVLVRADSDSLKRILSNLIDNSFQAIDGSGHIVVSLEFLKDKVFLKVSDNGRGIPAAVLQKIGNWGVTYGKKSGLGFGLYFARQQVERWGGVVEVRSEMGRGTEVLVLFEKICL